MSQMALLGSPAMSLPKAMPGSQKRVATVSRFRFQEESLCGLCWLVAIASSFFVIGVVGMLRFDLPEPIKMSGRAGLGAVDNESTDVSMAELLAEAEADLVNPTENVVEEAVDVPEPVEVALELLDLPEPTEALVTEDVFTVPAAPKIQEALKPVDPAKPKPKEQPKPKSVARPRSSRATSTVVATGGTSGSGGGGGGSGTKGSGAGKGKVPQPPFPSGARSRGVTGVVYFNLRVSPAGKVEYAAVVSSNCTNGGFTASEQSQVASYICQNWFLPGRMGSIRVPVRFVLR